MLESAWRNHVEPGWGAVPVNKVSATAVRNWSAQMTGAGCSATTVLRALGVLAGILDDAIADGRMRKTPHAVRTRRGGRSRPSRSASMSS
jgi:hypothetical protein